MTEFDPVPDAIAALQTKTKLQRHAIARLLKPDGPSLEVLRWVVAQPDCPAATAAMIFWRLRCLAPTAQSRMSVLELIVANFRANQYAAGGIAWDGTEAWRRTALIGGKLVVDWDPGEIPAQCFGPFNGESPEPATHAFFDAPYEEDDAFDSMWCINPILAAVADWLIGKPADVWMAAVDELQASHPNELYEWMVQQPECPAPVAGQIFRLRDPAPGPRPKTPSIGEDFDFWCVKRGLAGLVPRPRSAAVEEWKASLQPPPPEPQRAWQWRDLFRRSRS